MKHLNNYTWHRHVRWASRVQEMHQDSKTQKYGRRFKNAHNIISRKVTKFVTKNDLENKCIIENVKYYVNCYFDWYGQENIYNSNQSGFQLELHSDRTLSHKGVKKIEAVIQSILATTHNYTIQSPISADDKILSPLFIILREKNIWSKNAGKYISRHLIFLLRLSHQLN